VTRRFLPSTAAVCFALVLSAGAAASARPPASPDTVHVLWRDPGPIAQKDLFWGSASPDRGPRPPFTFIKEDTSGTKPKIDVKDAAGVQWGVKFVPPNPADNEVHAEIAASRLLWALGFFAEEHYFVPEGRIEGITALARAASVVGPNGEFKVARFERPSPFERRGGWEVENNRFNGTKELSALKIAVMLLGGWDARVENTAIQNVPLPNGDTEARYLFTDVGTAFGRMSGGVNKKHSRWNLQDYRGSRFIHKVVMNRLEFGDPLMGNTLVSVPIEHARWFATFAAQLTPEQVRRAFEASGASAAEIDGFAAEVMKRLTALREAVSPAGG
jgi:hypothetical protein